MQDADGSRMERRYAGNKRRRVDPASGAKKNRFKSDSSNLRWTKGQQKWFAKNYLALPKSGPLRSSFRPWIGDSYKTAGKEQKIVRRALGYYGEGDYKSFLQKYVPKGTFASAGRTLGGLTGIPGMNAVGSWAGNKLAHYAGFGDYSSNQIVHGGQPSQISVNQEDLSGDIYVCRTEFVQNVTVSGTAGAPTAFQVSQFPLNPGLSSSFPWLSQIAQNFTLYEFAGLMFQYKPLFSEDAGTSSNLGKVIFATEYDPSAAPFRTSIEMQNYDYANSTKPSQGLVHGVETANHQQALNMQYVRTGATTRDKIFTDIGLFQIGTEGVPLAAGVDRAIIGELWVTYKVKLSRAELYNSLLGLGISTDVLRGTWDTVAMDTGTTFTKSTNAIGVTVANVSSTTARISFPVNISLGTYSVYAEYVGAPLGVNCYLLPPNTPINCTLYFPGTTTVPSSGPGAISSECPAGLPAATSTKTCTTFYLQVNSPGLTRASVLLSLNTALPGGLGTWRMIISQANANVAVSVN